MYNIINSTIDGVRGKHDAYGSMAAGGLSGALFKSTGTLFLIRAHATNLINDNVSAFLSGSQACDGGRNINDRRRGDLELC